MIVQKPKLRRESTQTRGLVFCLPWRYPSERAGAISSLLYRDIIQVGGPSGGPAWVHDRRFGFVPDFGNDTSNRALKSTSYLVEPANLSPLSVTGWIWPYVIEDNATVFGKNVTYQAGWIVRTRLNSNRAGLRFDVQHSTSGLAASVDLSGMYLPQTWTHMAVTWDGTTTAANVTLYVNGVVRTDNRVSTNGVGTRKNDTTYSLAIGASNLVEPTAGKLKGRLGPVKVYNRILTSEEILQDYLYPNDFLVPEFVTRITRINLIPSASATRAIDFDRSASWNVRILIAMTRTTFWNVATVASSTYFDRQASWNVASTTVGAWPMGPINKPQLWEYGIRIITPWLVECYYIQTNDLPEAPPNEWNFITSDGISFQYLLKPDVTMFQVEQQ